MVTHVCIVGACGHVGIPLDLALATRDCTVSLVDTNKKAVDVGAMASNMARPRELIWQLFKRAKVDGIIANDTYGATKI